MQRQRNTDDHRIRTTDDGLPGGDSLDRQRSEIDGLLSISDQVFDSISILLAQDYQGQNLQAGGQ